LGFSPLEQKVAVVVELMVVIVVIVVVVVVVVDGITSWTIVFTPSPVPLPSLLFFLLCPSPHFPGGSEDHHGEGGSY